MALDSRGRLAVLALILVIGMLPGIGSAEVMPARVLFVVDGDTLHAELPGGRVEKIRVVGIDAPERGEHARCRAEADLAERARLHLVELLRRGPVTVETGRPERDRWKRLLGVVRVSGRDVAPLMVNASLARPYRGERRLSWCPA